MVHLLDRMGKHEEALHLIVDKLGDIKRAVDFVYQLRDLDDNRKLWELLIKKSLERAELISELLENAGGHIINPAKLIEQVCGCFVAHSPPRPFPLTFSIRPIAPRRTDPRKNAHLWPEKEGDQDHLRLHAPTAAEIRLQQDFEDGFGEFDQTAVQGATEGDPSGPWSHLPSFR